MSMSVRVSIIRTIFSETNGKNNYINILIRGRKINR